MLLLTTVNDKLQVITSANSVDVHATWVDTIPATGVITPGRTNTAMATAATASVAGSPAGSNLRNVKTLHIRNKALSGSCDVTVQHTDGVTTSQIYKVTLLVGGILQYTDQGGFVSL